MSRVVWNVCMDTSKIDELSIGDTVVMDCPTPRDTPDSDDPRGEEPTVRHPRPDFAPGAAAEAVPSSK